MVGQKFSTGPQLGDLEGISVVSFWNAPHLGESEIFLVGKRESEALVETYGDVARRSKRGCPLVKRMGLGLLNVCNEC